MLHGRYVSVVVIATIAIRLLICRNNFISAIDFDHINALILFAAADNRKLCLMSHVNKCEINLSKKASSKDIIIYKM